MLRAIAAAWFQANPGRNADNELIETLEVLGRELPVFVLPKVSFSRTVHYQPNYGATKMLPPEKAKLMLANGRYQRVRHENHFVGVGGDVMIRWRLAGVDDGIANNVRSLVAGITGRISYFGRAESVCEVEVVDAVNDDRDVATVAIQAGQPCRQMGSGFRDVFCTNPADFRATDLWQRRAESTASENAPKHLVQDLLDAPQPLPDGAAWFSYRMPSGWPQQWVIRHPVAPHRRKSDSRIIVRYLEFSLQCRIPVPAKHIVSIAELFRSAAISIHKEPSYALSGHDRPESMNVGHHHAFYLPQTNDSGQYLDRLIVWCSYGFNQREVDALMSVGALRWASGRFPVRPVLLRTQRELPSVQTSHIWASTTPFVPPRYWYRKKFAEGRVREPDSPENQLRQNLLENDVTPAATASVNSIRIADAEWEVCKVHLSKAAQLSRSEPDHRVGVFLKIAFETAVSLSLPAFGHSSHFGLGQFRPVADSTD
jgi:CRISPR-associated protein Csb2